ncbi:hypothetical protein ACFX12_037808 [Malus domestica]
MMFNLVGMQHQKKKLKVLRILIMTLKGKAEKGYHTHMGALLSSSRSVDYKFISKRQFEEFLVMMDVRLRTVVEELEAERRGRIELVVEVKNLRGNTADLTTPSLQPDTSIGEAKSSPGKGIIEVIGLGVNCLAFDVDLSEIIKAKNTNDVAQSLMHRLEFRVNSELGER